MGKIIVPNKNIIEIGFHTHIGMEGYYGLKRINKFSGKVVQEIKPFQNLVLNQGLTNYMFPSTQLNGAWAGILFVGTGNTTPQVTDTQLQATVTSSYYNHVQTNGYVASASPNPAYWYSRNSFTFPTGAAAGNLSEIGAAPDWASNPATALSSRALIVDSNGNPTTITVLSDEILTATYEIRYYLDTTDHSFSVNLNGAPITGIYRLCNITNAPGQLQFNLRNNNGVDYIYTYTGDIVPVTGAPSGNIGSIASTFVQAVNDITNTGTCYMDRVGTFTTTASNGTIKSIQLSGVMWNYQFGNFSSPIVKTNGQQFQINYRLSWGRYTP